MTKRTLMMAMAGAIAALTTGCNGGANPVINGNEVPSWYLNPPALCGRGSAPVRGTLDFAVDSAGASGRVDLAKQFGVEVKAMMEKYASEGSKDGGDFSEELAERVSREIVNMKLVGARPTKTHVATGGSKREVYMLVCLDAKVMDDALSQMNALSEKSRTVLRNAMEKKLAKLDELTEK